MVCSEGPRDFDEETQSGALTPILRRVLGEAELRGHRPRIKKRGRFGAPDDRKLAGLSGESFRLAAAMLDARRFEWSAVVWVRDVESNDTDLMRTRLDKLNEGRDRAWQLGAPPAAVGLAMPMMEAWLLGDPQWFQAHGVEREVREPEIETRKKESPRYAKAIVERALARSALPADRHGYAQLAEQLDLDAVARSCPRSFLPFLEELRALAGQLSTSG